MLRFMLILSVVAGLTACTKPKDDPRYPGPAAADVLHYTYFFDLNTQVATASLQMRTTQAGDCVTLPYRGEVPQEVSLDLVATSRVTVADDAIEACEVSGHGWPADSDVQLIVTAPVPYRVMAPLQVGYSNPPDAEGGPFYYMLSWIGGCDRHGPCDSRPDRFFTYEISVEHPQQAQVLCPGVIETTGFRTTCTFDYGGGPTYSTFGWMSSQNWTMSTLATASGVDINLYDFPSSQLATAIDAPSVSGFFTWMVDTFGPYPYGNELRLVATPSVWLGFEHPGNISLYQGLATFNNLWDDPATHTTMHEIGHMWAGDQTTLADTYDFGWKEAMVEYLTFVYESDQIDPVVGADSNLYWKNVSPGAQYYLVPEEHPELVDFYGDVYGPGPMILFRQLEGWLGRATIIQALQSVLGSESTLSMAQLRDALEVASGTDLHPYFDAWVFGTGVPAWPEATVDVVDVSGGDYQVSATLASSDGVTRGAKFVVQLLGGAGETFDVELDFGLDGDTPPAPQTVTPGFVVVDHVVDPYSQSLVREAGVAAAPAPRINPWLVAN